MAGALTFMSAAKCFGGRQNSLIVPEGKQPYLVLDYAKSAILSACTAAKICA